MLRILPAVGCGSDGGVRPIFYTSCDGTLIGCAARKCSATSLIILLDFHPRISTLCLPARKAAHVLSPQGFGRARLFCMTSLRRAAGQRPAGTAAAIGRAVRHQGDGAPCGHRRQRYEEAHRAGAGVPAAVGGDRLPSTRKHGFVGTGGAPHRAAPAFRQRLRSRGGSLARRLLHCRH
jgi:hypothetical protein